MKLLERIQMAFQALQRLNELDALISKIEALGTILVRLEAMEKHFESHPALESLAVRLDLLDQTVQKVESLEMPKALEVVHSNGKEVQPVQEQLHEWHRLQLLSQFVHLAGKAKEIELEWQRIQQDEHDFLFAFQVSRTEDSQAKYMFKKGIAEGVKWCVSRFC